LGFKAAIDSRISSRSIGRDANATRRWFQFSGYSALITNHGFTIVAAELGDFSVLADFSVLG